MKQIFQMQSQKRTKRTPTKEQTKQPQLPSTSLGSECRVPTHLNFKPSVPCGFYLPYSPVLPKPECDSSYDNASSSRGHSSFQSLPQTVAEHFEKSSWGKKKQDSKVL